LSWRGFVSYITQTKVDEFCVGDLVLGVVLDVSMLNHIVCHAGQLAFVLLDVKIESIADYTLTIVLATMALGLSQISCFCRLPVQIFFAAKNELAQIS
jgi:hypothetical protein